MNIGLDCDGVLADFEHGWRSQYNEWFNARSGEPTGAWTDFLDETHFAEEADFWAWVDAVPNFWVNFRPVPGAMGGVLELLKAGHNLCIITHRHAKASVQTEEWLSKYWPIYKGNYGVPIVHHTKEKWTVERQLYVDDGPKQIAELVENGKKVIKFEYPYNKNVKGAIGSVKGWDELVPRIAALEEALA